MRLKRKVILLVLPLQVVVFLIVGFIAFQILSQAYEQKLLGTMHSVIKQISFNTKTYVDAISSNLTLFSGSERIKRYALATDDDIRYSLLQPSLLKLFSSYQVAYPEYYEIRYLLMDGYEDARISSGSILNRYKSEKHTDYFKEMQSQENKRYSGLVFNEDTNEYAFIFSIRIDFKKPGVDPVSADMVPRGFLVLTVDLQYIKQQIDNSKIGESGFSFLVNKQGNIVYHPDQEKIGLNLSSSLFYEIQKKTSVGEYFFSKVDGDLILLMGKEIFPGLYLISWLPETEFSAASDKLGLAIVLGIFLGIVVTTGFLYEFLQKIIIEPISRLKDAAEMITQGRLDFMIESVSRDEIGELSERFSEMTDSLRASNDEVKFLAYNDPLTGLPNRALFTEHLRRSVVSAKRYNMLFSLFFLDLDNFKQVNDNLGHHAGDELICQFANRLRKILRPDDVVSRGHASVQIARIGGDEFNIILTDIKDEYSSAVVAQRILKSVSVPFNIDSQEIYVGVSIGITVFPNDGDTPEILLRNSDLAMYHAKERGKNNFQFYCHELNSKAKMHLVMERKLRKGLQNRTFTLLYQPFVDAKTERVVGAEALLRLYDAEEDCIVSPQDFVGVAEDTGLIVEIGAWVVSEACRQLKEWTRLGVKDIKVSVNVSSVQFKKQEMYSLIKDILAFNDLPGDFLEIELTESSILDGDEIVVLELTRIKELGVGISLDDFGTGYSSLTYLKRFPISKLKIDRSFVEDIHKTEDGTAIINAMIATSHSLKLEVTAEGVETLQQKQYLQDQNCDFLQGYLFGKPLSADEVYKLFLPELSSMSVPNLKSLGS